MDRVANLLERPKLYYNIDGVGELSVGLFCFAYAAFGWLEISSPEHSIWNQMYTLVAFFAVISAAIHYGSKAIKKRLTYPRTGFVAYRKRDTVWTPMALAGVIGALVSVGISLASRRHWNMTTPAALIGLIMAASYAYGFARSVGWKWVVVALMTFGSVAIALLPAETMNALAGSSWITHHLPARFVAAFLLSMTLYGVLLLISGGISFGLYLGAAHAPEED